MAARLTVALPATPPPVHLSSRVRREISRVTPSGAERKNAQLLPLMLTAAVIIMIGVAILQMNTAPSLHRSTDLASARTSAPPSAQARAEKQRTLMAPSAERKIHGAPEGRNDGRAQTGAITAGGQAKAMRALKSENFAREPAIAPALESVQDQAVTPPAQAAQPQVATDQPASATAVPATLAGPPAPVNAPSNALSARKNLFMQTTSETSAGLVNSATTSPLSADTRTSVSLTNPADAPTTSPAAPAPAP
jgi:hypothetical protein